MFLPRHGVLVMVAGKRGAKSAANPTSSRNRDQTAVSNATAADAVQNVARGEEAQSHGQVGSVARGRDGAEASLSTGERADARLQIERRRDA